MKLLGYDNKMDELKKMLLSRDVYDYNLAIPILESIFNSNMKLIDYIRSIFKNTDYYITIKNGDIIREELTGLFKQISSSNKTTYSYSNFSLTLLTEAITNFQTKK